MCCADEWFQDGTQYALIDDNTRVCAANVCCTK